MQSLIWIFLQAFLDEVYDVVTVPELVNQTVSVNLAMHDVSSDYFFIASKWRPAGEEFICDDTA